MGKVEDGIAILKNVGIHAEGTIEMLTVELIGAGIALAGTPPCGEKIQLVNKLKVVIDNFMIVHLEVQLAAAQLAIQLQPSNVAAQLVIPTLEANLHKYQEEMKNDKS